MGVSERKVIYGLWVGGVGGIITVLILLVLAFPVYDRCMGRGKVEGEARGGSVSVLRDERGTETTKHISLLSHAGEKPFVCSLIVTLSRTACSGVIIVFFFISILYSLSVSPYTI